MPPSAHSANRTVRLRTNCETQLMMLRIEGTTMGVVRGTGMGMGTWAIDEHWRNAPESCQFRTHPRPASAILFSDAN